MVARSRLVTLTGVGGAGKTRLALRAAANMRRAFPDGTVLVDLTRMRTPSLDAYDALAYLVMTALGLGEQGGGPPVRQLTGYLGDRQTLLVLDNCEHILHSCAILVDTLLRACPRLRVLTTSREPLAISGEVLYAVPPLPIPQAGRRSSLAELAVVDSVALLVARARAAVPDFTLTEANAEAVAELCRRLDGLPLPIELAAARLRALAPKQILERLTDRFALLSNGGRLTPARQRTLRASVQWSYDLCSKAERLLWARLSVFVGGFELDAAEGVCADDLLPAEDVLGHLASLVDKSIVESSTVNGMARYAVLETIRDFGQEQLVASGEHAVLRRRHRDWYSQLVERSAAEWISRRQVYWYARLPREYPNLRMAIGFSLAEPDEAEVALRILVSLPRAFWWSDAVTSEGRDWLDRALALAVVPTPLRARAMLLGSVLALVQGDADTGARLLDKGQRLAARLDDPLALGLVTEVRSQAALHGNDLARAIEFGERGLSIGPGASRSWLTLRLRLLLQIAVAAGLAGDRARAARCYHEILAIAEPRGESAYKSYATWGLGLAAWRAGDAGEAEDHLREGLRIARVAGLRYPYYSALNIELLAWVAAGQRRFRRAAILLGAADTQWNDRGQPFVTMHMLAADRATCERDARAALGDAGFDEAFRQGKALPYDEAFAYALQERRELTPQRSTGLDVRHLLTRRERQVAELIAQGLSNREIAARLVVSRRTAESHVEHILAKLGFTSRSQVAAWTTAQRPDEQA